MDCLAAPTLAGKLPVAPESKRYQYRIIRAFGSVRAINLRDAEDLGPQSGPHAVDKKVAAPRRLIDAKEIHR